MRPQRLRGELRGAVVSLPVGWAVATVAASPDDSPQMLEVLLRLDKPRFEVVEATGATVQIIDRGRSDHPGLASTERLPEALYFEDTRLRQRAANALCCLSDRQAVVQAALCLNDIRSDSVVPRVRTECAKQLWLLKDAAAKQTLVELLRGGDETLKTKTASFLQGASRARSGRPILAAGSSAQAGAS